ncbi:E3 ubiquitin-protein ligase DZIP3-like [Pollicipes pollicipes]|uniref:E3 ubiquitin-protein ligase DZIP3-like n=1 Tax=Pollicipes pollicipes TaxID=41117 RepID=UPI0018854025|nr:E3 ubiquitin-protein ligase DZIP3-like [Pollicipes pollicipes]
MVDEIMGRCGPSTGRDTVLHQLSAYRSRRGGTLRGVPSVQVISEVTALIRGGEANGSPGVAAGSGPAVQTVVSREVCTICLEPCQPNQSRQLQCGHQFHELCLRRWQSGGVITTCPNCRQLLAEVDFPPLE